MNGGFPSLCVLMFMQQTNRSAVARDRAKVRKEKVGGACARCLPICPCFAQRHYKLVEIQTELQQRQKQDGSGGPTVSA